MWQRLTVPTVDTFIRDLKEAIWDAKRSPGGKGTMVSLYGAYKIASMTLPEGPRFSRFCCAVLYFSLFVSVSLTGC
jgi:hypothetical protein